MKSCYFKNGLFLAILLISSTSFAGRIESGPIKASFSSMEKMIDAAILKAEELFEQNNGRKIKQINLLTKPNKIAEILRISSDYKVQFKFPTTKNPKNPKDIPIILSGVKIELRPIYNKGDSSITAWKCITNADVMYKKITGKSTEAIRKGGLSYITSPEYLNENQYLSMCNYAKQIF